MDQTEPEPEKIPANSEPNTAEDPDKGSHEFETDAMRLLAYAADALRDEREESPAFTIDRSRFNESGTPEMLHVGRGNEGDIVWAVWEGRSEVKSHIKGQSKKLYKRLRKLLMSYEMGQEIPVFTHGEGGHVGLALVTLEDRPQIKSPQ